MQNVLSEATIEQVQINDLGQVLIDVIDEYGESYEGVKVCGVGGNTLYWSNFPVRRGQRVKLVRGSMMEHPVCIGSAEVFLSEENLETLKPVGLEVAVQNTEDVVGNNATDYSVVNYKTGLKLTEKNGLVINSEQMMRFQLGEEALFRISKNGTTVDEPLNGQQFIDTLFAYLDVLEAKVNANSAAIGAQAPIVGGIPQAAAAAAATSRDTALAVPDPATAATFEATRAAEQAKADNIASTATDAQVALTLTSAGTKTSSEDNINRHVKLP